MEVLILIVCAGILQLEGAPTEGSTAAPTRSRDGQLSAACMSRRQPWLITREPPPTTPSTRIRTIPLNPAQDRSGRKVISIGGGVAFDYDFADLDVDNSGDVSIQELRAAMHRENPRVSEADVQRRFEEMDLNRDGGVTRAEFLEATKFRTLITRISNNDSGCNELVINELGDTEEGPGRSAEIAKALEVNSAVTDLNFALNDTFSVEHKLPVRRKRGLGDGGVTQLAAALKVNRTLTRINLNANHLSDNGATALAQVFTTKAFVAELAAFLPANRTLKALILSNNQIGASGASALAEALAATRSLTRIDLEANPLGPQGAKALGAALATNRTLVRLDLTSTRIGDQGSAHVSLALRQNRCLAALMLDANQISAQGMTQVADALHANCSLTALGIARNSIGDSGAESLAQALYNNNVLRVVWLGGNGISSAGTESLGQVLRTRRPPLASSQGAGPKLDIVGLDLRQAYDRLGLGRESQAWDNRRILNALWVQQLEAIRKTDARLCSDDIAALDANQYGDMGIDDLRQVIRPELGGAAQELEVEAARKDKIAINQSASPKLRSHDGGVTLREYPQAQERSKKQRAGRNRRLARERATGHALPLRGI